MRHPNGSWRVDETYIKVAGNWDYRYRAVDSAGETIEFRLSPNRELAAARLFLRLALSSAPPAPRVINWMAIPRMPAHRAGPSLDQEADHREPWLPFGGRGIAND
jgi:transposase-like protein